MTDLSKPLLEKLQVANKRSIFLTATCAKTSSDRLDASWLNSVVEGKAKDFLDLLLSSHEFSISISKKDVVALTASTAKQLRKDSNEKDSNDSVSNSTLEASKKALGTIKKLESLWQKQKIEEEERGTRSFGFGYPLLALNESTKENETILSPLFIWHLDISFDHKKNEYVISCDESHPMTFNPLLVNHLFRESGKDLRKIVDDTNEAYQDDSVLDLHEMAVILKTIAKDAVKFEEVDLSYESMCAVPQKKDEIKKYLENNSAAIINAGIFGIFRSPKKNIIADLEAFSQDEFETKESISQTEDNWPELAIPNLDPSQNMLLKKPDIEDESLEVVLHGPPGTGKSETITAVVTNALANRKRTLIVCEKKVALEVIESNLRKYGLDKLVGLIEDVDKDRKNIVERARAQYEKYEGCGKSKGLDMLKADLTRVTGEVDRILKKLKESVCKIDTHHKTHSEIENTLGGTAIDSIAWLINNDISNFNSGAEKVNEIRPKDFMNINLNESLDAITTLVDTKYEEETGLLSIPNSIFANYPEFKLFKEEIDKTIESMERFADSTDEFLESTEGKWVVDAISFLREASTFIRKVNLLNAYLSEPLETREDNQFLNEIVPIIRFLENAQNPIIKNLKKFEKIQSWLTEISTDLSQFLTLPVNGKSDIKKVKKYRKKLSNSLRKKLKPAYGWVEELQVSRIPFTHLGETFSFRTLTLGDLCTSEDIEINNKIEESIAKRVRENTDIHNKVSEILEQSIEKRIQSLELSELGQVIVKLVSPQLHYTTTNAQLDEVLNSVVEVKQNLPEYKNELSKHLRRVYDYKYAQTQAGVVVTNIVSVLFKQGLPDKKIAETFEVYFRNAHVENFMDQPILENNNEIEKMFSTRSTIVEELGCFINDIWMVERAIEMCSFETGDKNKITFKQLFNLRGTKGQRRNSLRKIVDKDFKLFSTLFPVIMCSPDVACTIIPKEKDLFDTIIFDEASQLRLEDTYTCIARGKRKIIAGDPNQMPPIAHFMGAGELIADDDRDLTEEEQEEFDLLLNQAASESLLAYAIDEKFDNKYLDFHYRSQHAALIEFSNQAFYKGRLVPVPGTESYSPIEYIKVEGTSVKRLNEIEAIKVVDWLKELSTDNTFDKSVGIVTFNMDQRNFIHSKISDERVLSNSFNVFMTKLDENGFFVKNVENVQGDERDIIVISTTYAPNEEGKFRQNFGPVANRSIGHKLLNVLVTRAKYKMIVFSSIPDEFINSFESEIITNGNIGKGMLYAYLYYVRAVSNHDTVDTDRVLKIIGRENNKTDDEGMRRNLFTKSLTDSAFEDEVIQYLEEKIDPARIIPQYSYGTDNFKIDLVIMDKDIKKPQLAIECDGYSYHSSNEAVLYDAHRQRILESKGFVFHRIWSTNWFRSNQEEKKILLKAIEAL